MSHVARRIDKLRRVLRRKSLGAGLITDVTNVRYLSGFTGDDSALLVGLRGASLITDFRYVEQAQKELRGTGIEMVQRKKSLLETIARAVQRLGVKAVAFEPEAMSVQTHGDLESRLASVSLTPVPRLASALRERKDAVEVAAIRRALTIAQTAFGAVVETLRPGISEREVAIELEYQMKHRGAMAAAFPIIVASGPRGSLPHGRPTDRRLRPAEPIVIDWGAVADFYCCDLTRTVFLGNIPRYWRGKYDLVLRAQARGIAALAGHGKASRADRMARGFLKRHRLGKRFGHGLGHGVGMATHEAPSLSQLSKTELQPGMVVTVEPGIYIPGRGGIRIEDMVLVRGGGAEVLSFLAKDVESAVI